MFAITAIAQQDGAVNHGGYRMRLNPFDTSKIDVGTTSGGLPGGKAGGLGCGTIILAAIGYFVFGLDPMQTAATVILFAFQRFTRFRLIIWRLALKRCSKMHGVCAPG